MKAAPADSQRRAKLAISNNASGHASAPDDHSISPDIYIYNDGLDTDNQLRASHHVAKMTVSEQFELVPDRQPPFPRQKDRKSRQAPPMIE
jgi:hypothetical protein